MPSQITVRSRASACAYSQWPADREQQRHDYEDEHECTEPEQKPGYFSNLRCLETARIHHGLNIAGAAAEKHRGAEHVPAWSGRYH